MFRRFISGLTLTVALAGSRILSAAPPITAAAFTPDGAAVVVGSQGGVEMLAWPGLAAQRRFPTELPHVHDLQFSPNGDKLAIVGGTPAQTGELEIFAWPTVERIAALSPHDDLIYAAAWRSDGRRLATASWDKASAVIDLTENSVAKLEGHSRGVVDAVFLSNAGTIVTASADQSLRVWDAASGRLLRSLENHTAAVHALALRPQAPGAPPMVASAGADETVRFWQPAIGRMVRFARLPGEPLDITWTPAGDRLLVACRDGRLRILDPENAEVVSDLPAIDGWAYTVACAPDGKSVLVAGEKGQVRRVLLEVKSR